MARNFVIVKSEHPLLPFDLWLKKNMGWSFDLTEAVRMYKWEAESWVKALERNGIKAEAIRLPKEGQGNDQRKIRVLDKHN